MGKLEQSGIAFEEKWKRDRIEDDAGESTDEATVPEPLGKQELRALLLARTKKKE